jgi:AhpD family alkylhydroperoxidase
MSLDFNLKGQLEHIPRQKRLLYRAVPDPMTRMEAMSKTVYQDSALPTKTKSLIALAMAVLAASAGCVLEHVTALVKQGLSRAELADACSVFLEMGGSVGAARAGQVLDLFDQLVCNS